MDSLRERNVHGNTVCPVSLAEAMGANLGGVSCTCQHAFIYSALPTDQDGITRQKGFALFQNQHISRNKMVRFQLLET